MTDQENDVFPDPPPGLRPGMSEIDENDVVWTMSEGGMLSLMPYKEFFKLYMLRGGGVRAALDGDGFVATIEARPVYTAPLWYNPGEPLDDKDSE